MIGQELKGRYRIIKALSSGGFAQTYIAEDTQRPGSPKCVVKHLMPATNNSQFMELARRLFNSEAQTLENLGRHDQIPQLLAYFEENQEFYLVQELIEGHPLRDEMPPGTQMSEPQVLGILQDVLKTLEFVHGHGVIHRDIKPHNIIRRQQDNKLVLIDFGAVKQIGTHLATTVGLGIASTASVVIGTNGYIPPEQAVGHPRLNSDIYALGMTAIQALTGLFPLQLPQDAYTGNLIWQNQVNVSEQLAAVLNKMIYRDCLGRYQSAAEVLNALKNITNFSSPTIALSGTTSSSSVTINLNFNIPTELRAKLEALLSEAIGPISKLLLKQAFKQALTPQDFVDRLVVHIPLHRQAEFRQQIQKALANANTQVKPPASEFPTVNMAPSTVTSIQVDPGFTRRCEQELSNFLGPIASFICKRTLNQNPGISPTQLIEALATQIPNPQQALEFRRRLLS